ncbi:MFS transporter [Bailinhaonella thermotolerans]|uniref:MFS transporter n=1 Tax=Bailinhaonella thermotolerans TaxID=1070861 RepID=A0A3A4ARN4_9ACTN|nr:MFS transporter [Bailinhaonella thermotolerans]RJL31791.1 MFS transporter [Bailinhaonella thermotolerans]
MASETVESAAAPVPGLWRHPDFLRLWTGQALSQFGSQITLVAIPLVAVVMLNASAAEMGLLGTLVRLPLLGFLFFGVFVDRMRRRRVLIWSDLGRAVVLAAIPALWLADGLSMPALYVVVFLLGLLTVFFQIAYRSYLPELVDVRQLADGNSKLQLTESLAQTLGPSAAAGLVRVLAAPLIILVDVVTYLASAVACALIRTPDRRPAAEEDGGNVLAAIWDGLRWVLRQPLLRPLAISAALYSMFVMGSLQAMFALYVLEGGPNVPVEWFGVILAFGGVGAIIGAWMSVRVMRRFGLGPVLLWSTVVGNLSLFLIPLAVRPVGLAIAMLAVAEFVTWMANQVFFVANMTLTQSITPGPKQGRVIGTIYSLGLIPAPLGTLGAGLLAEGIGLRHTLLIAVILGGLGPILLLVFSRVPRQREIPAPAEA